MTEKIGKKGASEVVGALLTVVVILTASGLIYLISHPVISNSIDSVNFRNAVKTMAEIKEIVQRMKYEGEVATTKSVQLNGGSISNSKSFNTTFRTSELPPGLSVAMAHAPPNINAIIHAAGDIEVNWKMADLSIDLPSRSIVFESGIFVKEGGRVIPIPISDPDVVATNDTIYISLYSFFGNYSAGGRKATINLKYINTVIFSDVNSFRIDSEFCDLWKNKIESELNSVMKKPAVFTDSDCSDNNIEISKSGGNITIIVADIEVT